MAKILITGIAGFIGSNFAYYIAENYKDYEIIGIDNLSPQSNLDNIKPLIDAKKVQFHKAAINKQDEVEPLYQKYNFDYIVNFAAESHNDRAILNPGVFMTSNALGVQVLLELSRHYGVQRHIQISTIEVYGEQAPDVLYFDESSPLNAKTPYSAAKAAGDIITRAYIQTYRDMDICLTHCANNYGPYQFPEKLIPLAISNVLTGKKVSLYGDGKQRRDWLHVRDHCRGIDLVLHHKRTEPINFDLAAIDSSLLPIYDFSARTELENVEIMRHVLDELGLNFEESVEFVKDRPNHDRRYLINPEKAERELGFKPEISLEQGIKEVVRWYVDNRNWWEAIIERAKNLQIVW